MKAIAGCLAVGACLLARTPFAACEMPSLVASIPDGATATEDELLAVQEQVTAYVAAMDKYIACENEDIRVQGENASAEFLVQMSTRIEAARNEVDAVATRFNEQVNAFRAATQGGAAPPPVDVPQRAPVPPR